jgi:hypothetical protein
MRGLRRWFYFSKLSVHRLAVLRWLFFRPLETGMAQNRQAEKISAFFS